MVAASLMMLGASLALAQRPTSASDSLVFPQMQPGTDGVLRPRGLYIDASYLMLDGSAFSMPSPFWLTTSRIMLLQLFDGRGGGEGRWRTARWFVDDTTIVSLEGDARMARLMARKPGRVTVTALAVPDSQETVGSATRPDTARVSVIITQPVRRVVVTALDSSYAVGRPGHFRVDTFDWNGYVAPGVPLTISVQEGRDRVDNGFWARSTQMGARVTLGWDREGQHWVIARAAYVYSADTIIVNVLPRGRP